MQMQGNMQMSSIAAQSIPAVDMKAFTTSDFVDMEYERCHPGDSWAALEKRAQFCAYARGIMREWMSLARLREAAAREQVRARMAKALEEHHEATLTSIIKMAA